VYYFSFWLLSNKNSRLFYANTPKCSQRLAHWTGFTVWYLIQAAPLSFNQICGRWTAQTLVCSTTRYGASSSSQFTSHSSITSTNWSNACSVYSFGTDNSISDNAADEQLDHFWSCMQANYGHWRNWCDSINIHLAIWHVMFHFHHTWYNLSFLVALFCNF